MSIPTDNTPPSAVPSIVDTLDPDLAAAYRSGNPTIMNAVAAGMTTTAMVVNEIIRMGGALNGLPPGVQALVNERKAAMDEQAAAENARLAKLAAAAVGAGLMATNIPQGAEGGMYYGESRSAQAPAYSATNPPTTEQFSQMSEVEKAAWRTSVLATTDKNWAEASQDARTQTVAIAQQDAADSQGKVSSAQIELTNAMLHDDRLGSSIPERQKSMKAVLQSVDEWKNANPDKSPQEYADHLLCTKHDLNTAQVAYAVQLLAIKQSSTHAEQAVEQGVVAAQAEERRDHAASLAGVKNTVANTQAVTNKLTAGQTAIASSPYLTPEVKQQVVQAGVESNAAMKEGVGSAAPEIMTAGTANLAAGATVDTQVAKANFEEKIKVEAAMSDEYPEDSAPRKPSIAASNLGNGPDSKLAQLGALPEAANDPKAPAVEPERPRVASLSQGMGA